MEAAEQVRKFEEFLDANYKAELIENIRKGNDYLHADFLKLSAFDPDLANLLLEDPENVLKAAEIAASNFQLSRRPVNFILRVFNLPESQTIKIRDIRSKHINKLFCVHGLVRRKTDVRPQVISSRFECPSCGNIIPILQLESKFREPSGCGCGRKGKFRLVSKELVDAQVIVLEEVPDQMEGGEQPKRIDVLLKKDLVSPLSDRKTNPGTKISLVGVLKEIPVIMRDGAKSTRFELIIEANYIQSKEEGFQDISITEDEMKQIKKLSKDKYLFERFVNSIAPSIYGHERIKEALVMQLLGGVRQMRADGVATRGDIHILLIGDPGSGKCLHPDTKIVCWDGSIKYIKDVVESNAERKVSENGFLPSAVFDVAALNEKAKIEKKDVTLVWKRPSPPKLLRIVTASGNEIKVTENHPFFVTNNGVIFSKQAHQLSTSDFVATPRVLDIGGHEQTIKINNLITSKANNRREIRVPEKVDENIARLFGYLVGDGYVNYSSTSGWISLTNNNDLILEDFKEIMEDKFNAKVTKRISHKGKSAKESYATSVEIVRILEGVEPTIIQKSRGKRIPDIINRSPKHILRSFLQALYECEGSVNKKRCSIEITSASGDLISDLKIALLRFGIIAFVNRKLKYASNTKKKIKREYYELVLYGDNVDKFYQEIGFLSKEKNNNLKIIFEYNKKHNTNTDVIPNLSKVLKMLRKEHSLLQRDFNIPRGTYNHYEIGDRNPSREKLKAIVERYSRSANNLNFAVNLLNNVVNADVFWDKIQEIKEIESDADYVYDLQVDGTHNYIANSIVVHNSQLLKRIAVVAPKGRYVSGKAASGAGLTAAVVKDDTFMGGWSLEAGALVLANQGICIIDELDKMNKDDRAAMHEALEQQSFHYDTIINFADGSEKKIGWFVEDLMSKNAEKIIRGKDCLVLPLKNKIELLTTDWEKIYNIEINRVSKHIAPDHFIRISAGNGREIVVTPEHPIFYIEDCKIKTISAENLKKGVWVPVPLEMPIKGEAQKFNISAEDCYIQKATQHIAVPVENGENFFKMIGYMLSEGSKELNRGKLIGINFSNKDTRLLDDFEKSMQELFKIEPYRQPRIDKHGTRYSSRFISRELAEFIRKVCPEILNKANKKEVPGVCMKGRKEDIAVMLSCMFEGDGHVSKKLRTIRVGFASNSKRMCEQVQDLLLRFSIRSNVTEHKESYKVSITGRENLFNFYKQIGFVTEEKNKVIKEYLANIKLPRSIKNNIPCVSNKVIELMKKYNVATVRNNKLATMKHDYLTRGKNISKGLLKDLIRKISPKNEDRADYGFLKKLALGDIGFEKVLSVERIENKDQKWTYDVTIEPTHNFISQNMVLHNTISISKANIQATLRSETTLLAAANPKMGRFDPFETIAKQIDLPNTLINRFDLIFPIKDLPDVEKDEKLSSFILGLHQKEVLEQDIPKDILRKYIAYAKQNISPKLTNDAMAEIKQYYMKMRSSGESDGHYKSVPISARQLEALVRLSEAAARLRLSEKVEKKDAQKAVDLLHYCLSQIGIDPETGKIDIDRIATGITASQRSKMHMLREIIAELEAQLNAKVIQIKDIVRLAKERGIEEAQTDELIERLKRDGDLFEPRHGYISRI